MLVIAMIRRKPAAPGQASSGAIFAKLHRLARRDASWCVGSCARPDDL